MRNDLVAALVIARDVTSLSNLGIETHFLENHIVLFNNSNSNIIPKDLMFYIYCSCNTKYNLNN